MEFRQHIQYTHRYTNNDSVRELCAERGEGKREREMWLDSMQSHRAAKMNRNEIEPIEDNERSRSSMMKNGTTVTKSINIKHTHNVTNFVVVL